MNEEDVPGLYKSYECPDGSIVGRVTFGDGKEQFIVYPADYHQHFSSAALVLVIGFGVMFGLCLFAYVFHEALEGAR